MQDNTNPIDEHHGEWEVSDVSGLGPRQFYRSDSSLAQAVRAKFDQDRKRDFHEVRIDDQEGVVTLDGQVPDEDTRLAAEQAAKAVKGVYQVKNNLKVRK